MTIVINFGNQEADYENKNKQRLHLQYPAIDAKKPIAPLADSYSLAGKQLIVLKS